MNLDCIIVWFLKVSILPHPIEGHCKFLGWGGGDLKTVKAQLLEERCEQATCKLELPVGAGGGGGTKQKPCKGRMDIFWNYTLPLHSYDFIFVVYCLQPQYQ